MLADTGERLHGTYGTVLKIAGRGRRIAARGSKVPGMIPESRSHDPRSRFILEMRGHDDGQYFAGREKWLHASPRLPSRYSPEILGLFARYFASDVTASHTGACPVEPEELVDEGASLSRRYHRQISRSRDALSRQLFLSCAFLAYIGRNIVIRRPPARVCFSMYLVRS
jgi:hypothetical protein